MIFYDRKPSGEAYQIVDEIVTISTTTDTALGTEGRYGYLNCVPTLSGIECWSNTSKTGTQYTINYSGTVTASTGVVKDISRGVVEFGESVPNTVYLTYSGIGSPLRGRDIRQSFGSIYSEIYPVNYLISNGMELLKNPEAMTDLIIKKIDIYFSSFGDCTFYLASPDGMQELNMTTSDNGYKSFVSDIPVRQDDSYQLTVYSVNEDVGMGWIRLYYQI